MYNELEKLVDYNEIFGWWAGILNGEFCNCQPKIVIHRNDFWLIQPIFLTNSTKFSND